jgi:hypothetical protein
MSGNPVKDALFSLLGSERFVTMAARGQYGQIAREAVLECADMVEDAETRGAVLETLSTGVLHHILTKSGTPSRRKAVHRGAELDIVIPGTRELEKSPRSALVIQVCCDCGQIEERLRHAGTVQPVRENIWILTQDCTGPFHYTISGEGATFPQMVARLIRFAGEHRHDRLRMAP